MERRATAIFQSCDSFEKEKSANETFCAIERCNAVPDSPIRFREYILTLDILFLHQYLIVANKMAVVCTPPRWAIKARGGPVIVNSRSRYILVCCHSCVRVCLRVACNACIPEREMEGEKEREGKLTKRESDGEKAERERGAKKRDDFKGKGRRRERKKERTNSWNLVAGRRPENCQSKVPRNERTSRGAASQTSFLSHKPRIFPRSLEL